MIIDLGNPRHQKQTPAAFGAFVALTHHGEENCRIYRSLTKDDRGLARDFLISGVHCEIQALCDVVRQAAGKGAARGVKELLVENIDTVAGVIAAAWTEDANALKRLFNSAEAWDHPPTGILADAVIAMAQGVDVRLQEVMDELKRRAGVPAGPMVPGSDAVN